MHSNWFDKLDRRMGWFMALVVVVNLVAYAGLAFVVWHFVTKWW